jgi:hypothetical protein
MYITGHSSEAMQLNGVLAGLRLFAEAAATIFPFESAVYRVFAEFIRWAFSAAKNFSSALR